MNSKPWPRAIILIDMNAFFASVEQLDNPALRGQPVAITNGEQGSCIITCSYEARRYGIHTGMSFREAMQYCPDLIRCPSRHKRYSEISKKIMHALSEVTPDLEIFSIDEAFLDVTRCQKLHGDPIKIGKLAQQKVFQASGLLCSIGISGDKTTAKYAAKLKKPNGFTVIPPWDAKESLKNVPVTELCGIAHGIGKFLAKYGVYFCGDMEKLPISILGKRFGAPGRRIWYMCQGADPEPLHTHVPPPKSMGHGKVIPPNTTDSYMILNYLAQMSEKLAQRLRQYQMYAQHFFVGVRNYELGWLGGETRLAVPSNDGKILFQLCQDMLKKSWHQEPVSQVQLTALDPSSSLQLDLFEKTPEILTDDERWKSIELETQRYFAFSAQYEYPDHKNPDITHKEFFPQISSSAITKDRQYLNGTVDKINQTFGNYSLVPARLLEKNKKPENIKTDV